MMTGGALARSWCVAAATLLVAWIAHAQTAAVPPAATCRLAPPPDTLLSLARCCAGSLAANSSCRAYDPARGSVVIKDNARDKPHAFLLIPFPPVTGIEDPQVLRPPVDDFFADAWTAARRYLGAPPESTALAINSVQGRTQNQLHIHISCVRPDVALALAQASIGTDPIHPTPLTLGPDGNAYRAVRVHGLDGAASPFRVVAAMPGAADAMGRQSVAAIGTAEPGSWVVVDTVADGRNPGAAEELLDQFCGAVTLAPAG